MQIKQSVDFQTSLERLTLDELTRAYARQCDNMQDMSKVVSSFNRRYHFRRLTIINNEIGKREANEN